MADETRKSRLVPDWRDCWRWWSVRLAVIAPIALEAVWYVLSSAPPELRAYVRLPLFFLIGALAILSRIWNQSREPD